MLGIACEVYEAAVRKGGDGISRGDSHWIFPLLFTSFTGPHCFDNSIISLTRSTLESFCRRFFSFRLFFFLSSITFYTRFSLFRRKE